jgi:PmbA protein
LIVKLEGGSGCSAISGEISIGAQGFLYEGGQRVRAVDRITLSTNFFDLMKNISGLSDEYPDAWSSMKVPDVLVEGVSVAG